MNGIVQWCADKFMQLSPKQQYILSMFIVLLVAILVTVAGFYFGGIISRWLAEKLTVFVAFIV